MVGQGETIGIKKRYIFISKINLLIWIFLFCISIHTTGKLWAWYYIYHHDQKLPVSLFTVLVGMCREESYYVWVLDVVLTPDIFKVKILHGIFVEYFVNYIFDAATRTIQTLLISSENPEKEKKSRYSLNMVVYFCICNHIDRVANFFVLFLSVIQKTDSTLASETSSNYIEKAHDSVSWISRSWA